MDRNIITAAVGVAGLVVGFVGGYILAKKRLVAVMEADYKDRLDEETARIEDFYKLMRKEPPYDDIRTATNAYSKRMDELESAIESQQWAAQAKEIIENNGYIYDNGDVAKTIDYSSISENDTETEESEAEVTYTLFDNDELRSQIKDRDMTKPYIITVSEFFDEHEDDFDKLTVTYFESDGILMDDHNVVIPDIEFNIGIDNLDHFGVGSNESHILYIRNEQLTNDYEVVLDDGSYTADVLGIDTDPKPRNKVRKMRDYDT